MLLLLLFDYSFIVKTINATSHVFVILINLIQDGYKSPFIYYISSILYKNVMLLNLF